MNSGEDFFDQWSKYYDPQHASMPDDDIEFYRELAVAVDGPVLEIGCGTGRIYLELLRAGVDIYGIDISEEMLVRLRTKAADEGLDPSVRCADITKFDPKYEYALVIIPYRTFLHMTGINDQQAALRNAHTALAPDGSLVLNADLPNFNDICESFGKELKGTLKYEGEEYYYTFKQEIVDEVEQITHVQQKLYDSDENLVAEGEMPIKLVSKREIDLLLSVTDYSQWKFYGGFDRKELISWEQEMVVIASP